MGSRLGRKRRQFDMMGEVRRGREDEVMGEDKRG